MTRTIAFPYPRPRYAHWFTSICAGFGLLVAAGPAAAQLPPGSFVQWDFNTRTLTPSFTAPGYPGVVTPTVTTFGSVTSSFINDASGQSGENPNPNFYLRTSGYPAAGGSGLNGLTLNSVDTTGRQDIVVHFSFGLTNAASRWYQPQYSTNGVSFTDFGGPLEYKFNADPGNPLGSPNWANPTTVSLAGISGVNGVSNLSFRLVSIFQPGTSSYQGVSGAYSSTGTANFDLVTFGTANRLSAGVSSPVTLTNAGNWSLGAIASGMFTSNLVFGQNTNGGVSAVAVDVPTLFQAQSITFASDANKPYTFSTTGGGTVVLRLGIADPTSIQNYVVGTTLTNASGLVHTFAMPVEISASQTWDVGAGLVFSDRIRFNLQNTAVGVPVLTLTGSGNATVSQIIEAITFVGSQKVVKNNSGALILTNSTGSVTPTAIINYEVNSGALRVLNMSGSATAGGSVVVNSSGRLEGTGRIEPAAGNSVTVNPGATIRGGFAAADGASGAEAVGNLMINGNVLMKGAAGGTGAAIAADFNGGAGSPSKVSVTGAGNVMNFDVTGGAFKIQLLNTSGLSAGTAYSVIIASSEGGFQRNGVGSTGSPPTFLASDFVLLGSFPGFTNVSLLVIGSGKDLQLNFTPVPEPAHALGLGAAALALWYRRRTRRAAIAAVK